MDKSRGLEDVKKCVAVMQDLITEGSRLDELPESLREALLTAAGRLSRPSRLELRLRNKQIKKARQRKTIAADRAARNSTGIREARKAEVYIAPAAQQVSIGTGPQLEKPRNCYVCKAEFRQLHHFYDCMCPSCAEFNYQKRFQTAPLHGKVAVITGSRLKIGYQATLMMLRSGAQVIATTRFPVDSAARFAREPDFAEWQDRLQIYGLDLRHTPSVEIFCNHLERSLDRLDLLINNAAQTVRRPSGFYAHLMPGERTPLEQLTPEVRQLLKPFHECIGQIDQTSHLPATWHDDGPGVGLRHSAELSQIPYSYDRSLKAEEVFPTGRLDADLQQVDLRTMNSWRLGLAEVPMLEMMEVQLVNSIAPFVLCSRLTPLMRRDNTGQKHIVNVSAMEGKFNRHTKTEKHPHTNMAKAALNMLTLTSARELAKDGIFMNAVDTGWVTDEDPAVLSQRKQERHDFQPPLDIVDGAARVCDPFFHGILSGQHWNGKFLKDYFPTEW